MATRTHLPPELKPKVEKSKIENGSYIRLKISGLLHSCGFAFSRWVVANMVLRDLSLLARGFGAFVTEGR